MSRYIIESRSASVWGEDESSCLPELGFVAEVVEGPAWACGTRGYGLTRQMAVADCKAGLPKTNRSDQFIHVEED